LLPLPASPLASQRLSRAASTAPVVEGLGIAKEGMMVKDYGFDPNAQRDEQASRNAAEVDRISTLVEADESRKNTIKRVAPMVSEILKLYAQADHYNQDVYSKPPKTLNVGVDAAVTKETIGAEWSLQGSARSGQAMDGVRVELHLEREPRFVVRWRSDLLPPPSEKNLKALIAALKGETGIDAALGEKLD
jgi:hypothetical protein